MKHQKIALTADNLLCEIIYRLYTNLLNDKWGVDCPELETDELLSLYMAKYNLNCEIPESINCYHIQLYDNDFNCDGALSFECSLNISIRQEDPCTPPRLQIRN